MTAGLPREREPRDLPMFSGMKVIESICLEQDGEPYTVRRSWRERLFTRPWSPLVAMRLVVPRIPYRGVVQLDEHTIVVHPQTYRELRDSLAERGR